MFLLHGRSLPTSLRSLASRNFLPATHPSFLTFRNFVLSKEAPMVPPINKKPTKYYAIKHGKRTGIFLNWNECKHYVNGFKGAQFKSFKSQTEAASWLDDTLSGISNVPAGRTQADTTHSSSQAVEVCPATILPPLGGRHQRPNSQQHRCAAHQSIVCQRRAYRSVSFVSFTTLMLLIF